MKESFFATHARMEDIHWWFLGRRDILEAILEECTVRGATGTVLDIGCGTGGNTARFAETHRAVGIEPSPEAVRLARTRFPSIEFIEGVAPDAAPDEVASADVLILTDVLEHVEHDAALVTRLVEGAKPGAWFIVTVPANEKLWTEHDVTHGHYRRYSMESFERLWKTVEVDTLLLSCFNSRLLPLVHAVRKWEQWKGSTTGEGATDLRLLPRPINATLRAIFAGEAGPLRRRFGREAPAYGFGVSLIGVFQKHRSAGGF